MLYVPTGFAHGFLVFSEHATVHYKTTAEFNAAADGGINPLDPALNIAWPDVPGFTPETFILSDKDRILPHLASI
jgi:dTDP-4-dehydrorhamnose 3,5-epimerase